MIPNASALLRVESDAATKADTRQHIGNDLNRLARADVCELTFLRSRSLFDHRFVHAPVGES